MGEFDNFSDVHTPISITIGAKKNFDPKPSRIDESEFFSGTKDTYEVHNSSRPDFVLKWNTDSKLMYENAFTNDDIDTLNTVLSEIKENPSQRGVDSFMDKIGELLIEKGKDIGVVKEKKNYSNRNSKKYHQPWFDNECRNTRENYYRVRNKLKFSDPMVREEKIKSASKRLKSLIKQKKI